MNCSIMLKIITSSEYNNADTDLSIPVVHPSAVDFPSFNRFSVFLILENFYLCCTFVGEFVFIFSWYFFEDRKCIIKPCLSHKFSQKYTSKFVCRIKPTKQIKHMLLWGGANTLLTNTFKPCIFWW